MTITYKSCLYKHTVPEKEQGEETNLMLPASFSKNKQMEIDGLSFIFSYPQHRGKMTDDRTIFNNNRLLGTRTFFHFLYPQMSSTTFLFRRCVYTCVSCFGGSEEEVVYPLGDVLSQGFRLHFKVYSEQEEVRYGLKIPPVCFHNSLNTLHAFLTRRYAAYTLLSWSSSPFL